MAVSKTLVSNQVISAPAVSPATDLSGNAIYWTATLDATVHTGVFCAFTIQSSPDNRNWTDVSNNSFWGDDGIGHLGNDLSHLVETFTLFGTGPWWRVNITQVIGSFTVNSVVVTNFN